MKNLDRFEVWLNLFEGSDFLVNVFLTPCLDVVLVLTAKPEARCHSKKSNLPDTARVLEIALELLF